MVKEIGFLDINIAKAINCISAPICISDSYLRHIEKGHSKELDQLGINAFEYVCMIVTQYTEIRKGNGGTIKLLMYAKGKGNIAVIDLSFSK